MLAMSGRIVVAQQSEALLEHFEASTAEGELPKPSYNVAPGDAVPLVLESGKAPHPGRRLMAARWGLEPRVRTAPGGTAPDAAAQPAPTLLFNARAETVNTAPRFAGLFRRRRALLPADGYYAWTSQDGVKQPHYLHPADDAPLALAALYEWHRPSADEPWQLHCTLLTRPAAGAAKGYGERMPLAVAAEFWSDWLNPDREVLLGMYGRLLSGAVAAAEQFSVHRVSREVSPTNRRADGPELIQPLV